MGQPSVDRPKPKRGRPPKYASAEERKAAQSAREREKRQAARAAQPLRFVQYHSPAVPRSTGIAENPSSYFPPGELCLGTEVEQLLPPLSPGLEAEEPFGLEYQSDNNALPLDIVSNMSIEPTWTDASPQTAASKTLQAGQRPDPIASSSEGVLPEPAPYTFTRWTVYFRDLDPLELIQCVQQPVPEDQSEEALTTAAIWASMAAVARMSQKLCADVRVGRNILVDAARVERNKTPAQPLRAIMDENAIAQHCVAWQQVLMFFARTQVPHHWRSPRYSFTPQQRAAWEKLWHEAQEVARSDELGSPARTPSPVPSLTSEDASYEVEHASCDTEWKLSPIDTACLDFCMELLNQRSRAADYESALVCAVAVQGRGETGWRDANSYSPILSRIIKVARLMLVHKAMRLASEGVEIIKILPECGMAGTGDKPHGSNPASPAEQVHSGTVFLGWSTSS
ncbi:hypothetical protein N7535_007155 [Penicillium sp. DV-2018c]|nr:hypothetical protein N7535_007155 [Penicillium sp. DV-2018c]